jgi:capsular polysaccharide biosynthesis protein
VDARQTAAQVISSEITGEMMADLDMKLIKLLHDTKAAFWTKAGHRLKYVSEHPNILGKILIQNHSVTRYTNEFEKSYYGHCEPFDFIHPETYFHVLKDVWVVGSEAHVFFEPDQLFSICSSLRGVAERKIRRPIPCLSQIIEEPVFILASRAPGNRGHFLVEHLARLTASGGIIKEFGGCKYLVTAGHRKWQLPYLKKMGIPESDVIEADIGSTFCKRAYYVPTLCTGEIVTASLDRYYHDLRNRFLAGVKPAGKGAPVFLTRKDAPDRKLSNEDEIFSIAKSFFPDIESVALSKLSLEQQISLFQEAPVVMGAHSQSFRNVLFTGDALVVQLLQGFRKFSNEYYKWAQNYNYLGNIGHSLCLPLFSEIPFNTNQDWIYPADKFEKEMSRLIVLLKDQKYHIA